MGSKINRSGSEVRGCVTDRVSSSARWSAAAVLAVVDILLAAVSTAGAMYVVMESRCRAWVSAGAAFYPFAFLRAINGRVGCGGCG
jgi:hypothetical protein